MTMPGTRITRNSGKKFNELIAKIGAAGPVDHNYFGGDEEFNIMVQTAKGTGESGSERGAMVEKAKKKSMRLTIIVCSILWYVTLLVFGRPIPAPCHRRYCD